ncbi:NfeD family protein [Paenibacillus endoradicis]|uniref:NfeD family protein n=1 Tax=Paenibacillus endoradicis TaxID=2972487 RepID=UPI00215993BF|nr:NfeD family protein [Paenibacillus endoradicis]MCR8656085.1 protease [Paenibacillus endoradicis]MCR8658411.1 protease [Paenibacillus endoradicis]
METLYWGCLIFGILYTIVVVIFGDVLEGALDASLEWLQLDNLPLIQPITLVGGLAIFGGAGILLMHYTDFATAMVILISICIGIIGIILIYFVYVKPMENAEMSTSYSMLELVGKEAVVTTPVPVEGFGEVIVKTIAGITSHIAASYDKQPIAAGNHVVVVEVHESILYVAEIHL